MAKSKYEKLTSDIYCFADDLGIALGEVEPEEQYDICTLVGLDPAEVQWNADAEEGYDPVRRGNFSLEAKRIFQKKLGINPADSQAPWPPEPLKAEYAPQNMIGLAHLARADQREFDKRKALLAEAEREEIEGHTSAAAKLYEQADDEDETFDGTEVEDYADSASLVASGIEFDSVANGDEDVILPDLTDDATQTEALNLLVSLQGSDIAQGRMLAAIHNLLYDLWAEPVDVHGVGS